MAKTIFEQTGWRRPHPQTILQDTATLMRIYEFDYNLSDPGFVRYFESRTGVMISRMDCGWQRTRQLLDAAAEEPDPVHQITRCRLQDCWELYLKTG